MTQNGRDAAFTEYVAAAGPWLRRVAYLLCRDWHRADDLVQTSITRLYVHWNRASRVENVDGYARAILFNAFLAEQRSPWWKRVVVHRDPVESAVFDFDVDTSLDLRNALASVPPRQRATLVLRYFCDLSVEQTASVLGAGVSVLAQSGDQVVRGRVVATAVRAAARARGEYGEQGGRRDGETAHGPHGSPTDR